MKPEVKKLILLNLPYLLFVYLFGKVGQAFRLAQGIDLSAKLLHIGQGFTAAFSSAAPSFHPVDLLIGIAGAVIIRLVVYSKQKNAKKYRKGMEYGTARWGTSADIKPFIDPVFENNVLLTQTERLMMSNRPKDPKNARNKNILVIGGSGSGKTRFFAKPNIMQLHSSYVITDPKGSLICEVGQLLQRAKYRIKVLNTINFSKSMHYNPFAYLRSEKDILKLVNTIIVNTKGEGAQSAEDFWVKSERLFYSALIGYIFYEAPEEEKNFTTIDNLCALPVAELTAKDCALFLWATFPQLPEALRLINAWGFQYKTVAFVWLKRNRKNPTWFYGLGYWTRGNAEICLLATKGKPKRQSAGVHQFIISPIEQHSKKPDEARQKILALMGDLPRLELFARQKAPGWDVWGNEIASDITLAERRNDGLCECAEGLEQD